MNKKKNIVTFGLALVSVPVIFMALKWLVVDFQIDPQWLTLLFVYCIIVIPQYNTIKRLEQINAFQDGEDHTGVKISFWNYFIFVNDWILADYFNDGTPFKKITGILLKVSTVLFVVTTSYNNALVVFFDIGGTLGLVSVYTMLISGVVWIVTKSLIVACFLFELRGLGWALTALIFPIGFLTLNRSIEDYIIYSDEQSMANAMGINYEEE